LESAVDNAENITVLFEEEGFLILIGVISNGIGFVGIGKRRVALFNNDVIGVKSEAGESFGDGAEGCATIDDVIRFHETFADEFFVDEIDDTGKANLTDGGLTEREDGAGKFVEIHRYILMSYD